MPQADCSTPSYFTEPSYCPLDAKRLARAHRQPYASALWISISDAFRFWAATLFWKRTYGILFRQASRLSNRTLLLQRNRPFWALYQAAGKYGTYSNEMADSYKRNGTWLMRICHRTARSDQLQLLSLYAYTIDSNGARLWIAGIVWSCCKRWSLPKRNRLQLLRTKFSRKILSKWKIT